MFFSLTSQQINTIVFFVCILVLTIISYRNKYKHYRILRFILVLYSISVLCSFLFMFFPMWDIHCAGTITLLPYLYWLAIFLFCLLPIIKYEGYKVNKVVFNIDIINYLGIFGLIISLAPFIESVLHVGTIYSRSNLSNVVFDQHENVSLDYLSSISRFLFSILSHLYEIFLFCLIPMIINQKKNRFALTGVVLVIISMNFHGIIIASRNYLFKLVLQLLLTYLIILPWVQENIRIKIRKYFLGAFAFVAIFFVVISFARQSVWQSENQDVTMSYFLFRYAGEGFLHFNANLTHIIHHTDGDLCFSVFKKIIGNNAVTFDSAYDYWDYLKYHTGVDMRIFYTYLGFFVFDIGFTGTFIFWISFVFIIRQLIISKGRKIELSSLFVFYIYTTIIVNGTCLNYFNNSKDANIIAIILFYFFLRIRELSYRSHIKIV